MSATVTSTRRRWALNYYITQCSGNSMSWRQDVVEKASTQQREQGPRLISLEIRRVRDKIRQREPSGPRSISWGSDELEIRCGRENQHPQAPGWAAQENRKETWLWPIEWGSICCSICSVSISLSHTTLSIKWEVYFSKELCRSSLLCCCYNFACRWVYNTCTHLLGIFKLMNERKLCKLTFYNKS